MNNSLITLSPLNHLGLLDIEGPDCAKFLQGQLTCNVETLTADHWTHGAHCTPKGRMIANFDALAHHNTVTLRLYRDTLPILKASLGKYIIFSKAQLKDQSDDIQIFGLMGPNIENWLSTNLDIQFSEPHCAVQQQGMTFLKLDDLRIECWIAKNNELPTALATLPHQTDPTSWLTRDIERGHGWVCAATVETFIPQHLNLQLDAIGGIDFKKGCYTGQEIVARMHYKGKLKRHMYRFQLPGSQTIPPGADLYSGRQQDSNNTQQPATKIGHVINSVFQNNKTELLAVVTDINTTSKCVYLQPDSTQKLEQRPLPYAITTES